MAYKSLLCLLVFLMPLNALCGPNAVAVIPFHRDKATVASQYHAATFGLDPSKSLRWRFYWSARKKNDLTEYAAGLKIKLYVVVEESQDAAGRYRLQLERIDILTIDDLIARNSTFFNHAKDWGRTYEGWSVAPL